LSSNPFQPISERDIKIKKETNYSLFLIDFDTKTILFFQMRFLPFVFLLETNLEKLKPIQKSLRQH
jgi:hypothetical protein